MKKIAFLLSFFANCTLLLGQSKIPPAQNAQPKPFEAIRVIKDQEAGINVAVEFWDSITNKRLKRLDLIKISPFYNLKGREVGLDEAFHTPCYRVPFGMLKTDSLFKLTDKEMQFFFPNTDSVGVRIHSWVTDRLEIALPREEIGILHVMEVVGHLHDFAAARLALAVYDKKGTLLYEHQGLTDDGSGRSFLIGSGRFFCYGSGSDYGEGLKSCIPMSHKVFDLKEKKVVVNGSRDNQLHTYGINDYFYATYRQTQISREKYWAEWTLYDVQNNLKYYKEYDVFEIGYMIQADMQGVLMHSDVSKQTSRLEFAKDFIVTKIKQ